MNNYEQTSVEEIQYLESTLDFIRKEIEKAQTSLGKRRSTLIASRREMWQESVHFSNDFDRIPEMNQYLSEVTHETRSYEGTEKQIEKYNQMLNSPYFGRFDFQEDGYEDREKIYIGLYNLIDQDSNTILVSDWRSPVSSIFYQCEIGRGSYNSPVGVISGDISLKRQYKIQHGQLKYFFDSSLRINDEILQEVLCHNTSPNMKSIVQTIQKEQDLIIRDTESDLLIVQGVAGSGKTSVALHRIAFLLYIGMSSKLRSNNVIIISPNSTFSKYISKVLPELGEENVEQITVDHITHALLGNEFTIEDRNVQLESLILLKDHENLNRKMESIHFKGSNIFVQILDRFLHYYEHNLLPFEDVYYAGKVIESKQQLKNLFLNNKINMPMTKRLQRIESILLKKIHPLRKMRLGKIEKIVQNSVGHDFEIKSFSRLISIKETQKFMNRLHKFTQVDYMNLYKLLFEKTGLLLKLSKGLELPMNIDQILLETKNALNDGYIPYEDCAPLLYIKIKLEGFKGFSDIKQVIIDEAQDYYPLQYEVFKLLFNEARYTVLGDFNQTLEKNSDKSIYEHIEKILHKKKSVKLYMNKSFRSSIEINSFTQKILNNNQEFISFERHEAEPKILYKSSKALLHETMMQDIILYQEQGYESIAIICKTEEETKEVEEALKSFSIKIKKHPIILPSYMAKGLEFDVVLVYNVSKDIYSNEFDKRLLYIACTRALHQLALYYTGEKSPLLTF